MQPNVKISLMEKPMNILTVYAHPNPKSFCHAILQQFTKGLEDAGHTSEVVDLYAIRFDPVFRMQDFASYVHETMPADILERMDLKQHVLDFAGGPIQRFIRLVLAPRQGFCSSGEIHPRT